MKTIDVLLEFLNRFFKSDWQTRPGSTDPEFERLFSLSLCPLVIPALLLISKAYLSQSFVDSITKTFAELTVALAWIIYVTAATGRAYGKITSLRRGR